MRALRVVGLSEDGKSVICEDVARSERFTVPADERLRAAARGDVTRLGQIEIELESQMRPREIQARIRAGESVDQVAAAAGVPAQRVERFAYPVLLERSRTAELAQRAHPVREDGPDVQTLAEVAAHAFGLRGQDYATAAWDSWRGEDGKWVVQLLWNTGRSDNRAHWAFHPGAHGGTVIPLDEHAHDLMDPNAANRPLRTVRPVTELARQALEAQPLREEEPPYQDYDYFEPMRDREPVREPVRDRDRDREPLREQAPEPVWEREPVRREPVREHVRERESVREREPVREWESARERESVREREPVRERESAREREPVVRESVREREPVRDREPVREREPVRREPVARESVREREPLREPVVPEPVVRRRPEPEPVVPEPVVRRRPEPEPVVAEPVVAEPVVAEPVVAEPVVAEPVVDLSPS